MKDIKFLYILLLLSILLFSIKSFDSSNQIHYVIDGLANGSAAFVDLENVEDNYVYFSFDFDYHNDLVPSSKDIAFFCIYSNIGAIKGDSIEYALSKTAWYKIDSIDDIKEWNNVNNEYGKKTSSKDKNYYKIEKTNDKMKTLLLRVSINEKKGYLMVENIPYLQQKKND